MRDFLVFQLYGALASWGDIAVGEQRPTLGHPTKSAITGMLAAALGIDRKDENVHQQLAEQYGTAVCVRASGELLRDYHTVQVPSGKREYASRRDELTLDRLNLKTILSQRDYRTDALYQVAIWCRDSKPVFDLDVLRDALLVPHFVPYLGRKACPVSLPLFPLLAEGSSLKQAFDDYPTDKAALWTGQLSSDELIRYYWEGGLSQTEMGELEATMVYPRRDQVRSRKRWQFDNRDEFYGSAVNGGV